MLPTSVASSAKAPWSVARCFAFWFHPQSSMIGTYNYISLCNQAVPSVLSSKCTCTAFFLWGRDGYPSEFHFKTSEICWQLQVCMEKGMAINWLFFPFFCEEFICCAFIPVPPERNSLTTTHSSMHLRTDFSSCCSFFRTYSLLRGKGLCDSVSELVWWSQMHPSWPQRLVQLPVTFCICSVPVTAQSVAHKVMASTRICSKDSRALSALCKYN